MLINATRKIALYSSSDGWYEKTVLTRNDLNLSEFPESNWLNLVVAPLI